MNKNKIVMFFCDYNVIHSTVGKQLGLDRKSEIKTFISSLEQLRINEKADQVLLTFISDNEEFKDNLKNIINEFSDMIKENNIVFGNHFDHKFSYSCNGIYSDNTENILTNNSNIVIGDKISHMIKNFISNDNQDIYNNQITSVRVARNNIGETSEIDKLLTSQNIKMVHYTFDPFITNLPNNPVITYNTNMMHANWTDLTALNAVLSNELGRIKKRQQKQAIMVYKK